jgi:predicted phosphodiesterase
MSSLDEYAGNRAPLPEVPKGFEAVVESDGRTGKAQNIAVAEQADDLALLFGAGLDPKAWVITPGTRRHKRWQRYDGEWLNWWSFTFEERTSETEDERKADIAELKALFKKAKPKRPTPIVGTDAFVFLGTDWQIGKGEGGGSAASIERIRDGIQQSVDFVKQQRKMGARMPVGSFLGTGDLHESCSGFYEMQLFQTDLNHRDQAKVVRRLIREAVESLAPMFDEFIVAGVAGNHGEASRTNGKANTTFADNNDIAVLEVVQEVLADRHGFDHVKFHVPDEELSMVLGINGVSVGLAHGHQFGGGATAQKKAENWWAYQTFGRQPLAAAQILFSGHYHHFSANTYGSRTHFQGPSQDGGSLWFKNSTGVDSPTGQLVVVLDSAHPLGWNQVRVL